MNLIGTASTSYARGACYLCLRNERLVDCEAVIEGEGVLAICTGCITEASEAAGLTFNEARVRELEQDLAHAEAALASSQKLESEFQAVITRLQKRK